MSKKITKTNAMRALDKLKLNYKCTEYEAGDGKIDGVSVAEKIGKLKDEVFKTLVTKAPSGNYYIFIVPVDHELNLKKCAKACGEKSVEMIAVKDITKVTGYIRGGCSPLAMKKQYPTFLHKSAEALPAVTFSGGKIGVQITMNPDDLLKACGGVYAELTDE